MMSDTVACPRCGCVQFALSLDGLNWDTIRRSETKTLICMICGHRIVIRETELDILARRQKRSDFRP